MTGKGPVAATDMHYLRFFTFSGVQSYMKCLSGPIISMAGSQKYLFVVYLQGPAIKSMKCDIYCLCDNLCKLLEDQNLGYFVMDVETKKMIIQDKLPLSPESTLEWVAVSDFEVNYFVAYNCRKTYSDLINYSSL